MSQPQDMIPGSPIGTPRRKLNLSNEKSRKKSQKRKKTRDKAKTNTNSKISEEKNTSEISEPSKNPSNEINLNFNLSISGMPKNDINNVSVSEKKDDKIKIENCDQNEIVKSEKVVKKRRLGYGRNNSAVEISNLGGKSSRRKIVGHNSESIIEQMKENEDQRDNVDNVPAIETKEKVIEIEHCEPCCSKLPDPKKEIETNILMKKKLNDTLYDLSSVFESSFTEEIEISNQINKENSPNKTIVNMDDTSCVTKTGKNNLDEEFDELDENMLLEIFKEDEINEVEQINKAEVKNGRNEPNILQINKDKPTFIGFQTANYTKVKISESKLENALEIYHKISHEIDIESTANVSDNEKDSPRKMSKNPQKASLSSLSASTSNTTFATESGLYNLRTPNSNRKSIQKLDEEFDELDEHVLLNIFKEDQLYRIEQVKMAVVEENERNEPNVLHLNEDKPKFIGSQPANYPKLTISETKLKNALEINYKISHEIDAENTENFSDNIKKLNKFPLNQSSFLSESILTVSDNRTAIPTEPGGFNLRYRKSTPNQKSPSNQSSNTTRNRLSLKRKRLSDNISTPKQCGGITQTLSTPDFNKFCGVTRTSTPKDSQFCGKMNRENSKENENQKDTSKLYDPKENLNVPESGIIGLKKTCSENQKKLSFEKTKGKQIQIEHCDNNFSNNNEINLNEIVKSEKVVKKRRLGYGRNNSAVEISNLGGKSSRRKIVGHNSESIIEQMKENEDQRDNVDNVPAIETKEKVIEIEHCEPCCSKLPDPKKEIETNILMKKKLNDTLYDLSSVFESSFTEEIEISNQINKENSPNKTIVNMDDTSCVTKTGKNNLDEEFDELDENMLLEIFKEDEINEVEQINKAEVKNGRNEPNILKINKDKPTFIGFQTANYTKVKISESKLENALEIYHKISHEIDIESTANVSDNEKDSPRKMSKNPQKASLSSLCASTSNTTFATESGRNIIMSRHVSSLKGLRRILDDSTTLKQYNKDLENISTANFDKYCDSLCASTAKDSQQSDISGISYVHVPEEIQCNDKTNNKCMIHDRKQIKFVSNCDCKADIQNCDNNVQKKDVEEVNEFLVKTEKYQKSNILLVLDILRERESKKIAPINNMGSLFWKRITFKRVPVYNFIKIQRKKMNLNVMSFAEQLIISKRFSTLSKLNYSNALNYKFDFSLTDYYPIMLITSDETIIIPDNDFRIGFKQIVNSFRKIINSKHNLVIGDNWIENHYRQILLKLANYEINYPDVFLNYCCRPEIILEQLKYRYNIEFNAGRKSCLKTLIFNAKNNKQMISLYPMVLIVSDIVTDDSNNIELFLSDKWYVVKTSYDAAMRKLINNNKVRVGTKLFIENAELINFPNGNNYDGDDFVMLLSKVKLKIHTNSIRRARFNAKLGYKFLTNPLDICLDSVSLQGGNIASLTLVIDQIYPLFRRDQKYEINAQSNFDPTAELNSKFNYSDATGILPNVGILSEKNEVVIGVNCPHQDKHGEDFKDILKIRVHDATKSEFSAIILILNMKDEGNELRVNSCINIRNVRIYGLHKNYLLLVHDNELNKVKIL